MKKTLLAAAALIAVSGSAVAQSSVTLYGVVDLSLESVKGADSTTRLSSSNYASSRLGFRGVEDLGAGQKAKFVLESGINADTGAQGNTRFFDRSSWIGLEGGFGELRLGRIDSSIGFISGNSSIVGAQAYDDLKIAKTFGGDKYRRVDNSITYLLPKFVDGLTGQVQYSLAAGTSSTPGAETSDVDTGKAFSFNLQYAAGPFGAGLGYINAKANAAGDVKDKGVLVYGSYDFGAAKLIGYFNNDSTDNTAEDARVVGLRVVVPVGTNFSLSAGVSQVKDSTKAANVEDDATIFAFKGVYTLSKRTALYGLITTVDNDDGASLGVVTTPAGKNSSGIAFGVRHSF